MHSLRTETVLRIGPSLQFAPGLTLESRKIRRFPDGFPFLYSDSYRKAEGDDFLDARVLQCSPCNRDREINPSHRSFRNNSRANARSETSSFSGSDNSLACPAHLPPLYRRFPTLFFGFSVNPFLSPPCPRMDNSRGYRLRARISRTRRGHASGNRALEHALSRTAHHLSTTDRSSASSSWPTSAYESRRPIEAAAATATAAEAEADTAASARCCRGSARWTTRMIGRRAAVMSTHVYRARCTPPRAAT